MGLPSGGWHLNLSVVVQNLSAPTRFFGRTNEVQDAASRLLQCAILVARLCLELSSQCLRELRSRASIRPRHTEFPRLVWRAVDWRWYHARRRNDPFHRAVRCVPASTENLVDLGTRAAFFFLFCRPPLRAGFPRAAFQYV